MENHTTQKPGNPAVRIGEESGYPLFFHGTSYNCPQMKFYGFSTERKLRSRIRAKLKKDAPAAGLVKGCS